MAVLRAARGALPAPQPTPCQAPSPSFIPTEAPALQHHDLWDLGGFSALPVPCSSSSHRGTYMAHCSFSFLMEPYSACRERSGGSAGE